MDTPSPVTEVYADVVTGFLFDINKTASTEYGASFETLAQTDPLRAYRLLRFSMFNMARQLDAYIGHPTPESGNFEPGPNVKDTDARFPDTPTSALNVSVRLIVTKDAFGNALPKVNGKSAVQEILSFVVEPPNYA